eukprot:364602-Chlamydomonas_euryale.AAC.1
MASMHGEEACMLRRHVGMHGEEAWEGCMARRHGRHALRGSMEGMDVAHAYWLCMERAHGAHAWVAA